MGYSHPIKYAYYIMILNLANPTSPKQGGIEYERTTFPDTHQRIKLLSEIKSDAGRVLIMTRLSTTDDIFVLLQATKAIRAKGYTGPIDLYISYLFTARYDRAMFADDTCDLELTCDMIAMGGYRKITLVEPHSQASCSLLRTYDIVHPLDAYLTKYMTKFVIGQGVNKRYEDVCLVAPDLGAAKRVDAFAAKLPFKVPVVYCNKTRDPKSGSVQTIEILNKHALRKNIVIYDDLCDGGRTYEELAAVITSMGGDSPRTKITLAITHGLFTHGTTSLVKAGISEVITTNAYKELNQESLAGKGMTVHVIPVI